MKYKEHRHDGIPKPGEHFVPRVKAAPELHELLERKGFKFLEGPADNFYRFGKDDDWPDPYKQPLISVYKDDSWDGRSIPDYPIKPGSELKDYLESLPAFPLEVQTVAHNPQKDQENQITHYEVEPHSDLKKVRPNVLVPDDNGNVSLERREESILPPESTQKPKETDNS